MAIQKYATLRLILGDQLNHQHSCLEQVREDVLYVMMEVRQETDYVDHHIQKVVAFFLAMRSFAKYLEEEGHAIKYFKLYDEDNTQSLIENLKGLIKRHGIQQFEYQLPDEYRLDQQLKEFCETLDFATEHFDTEHFLTERNDLADFFKGKKTYLMESFYRHMRRQHNIMMDGSQPVTGQWNYDKSNRKCLPEDVAVPAAKQYPRDVKEVLSLLKEQKVSTIGHIDAGQFIWPVTREESLDLLNYFVKECLPHFGDYQDAMSKQHWSVFHSRLSFAMNVKLLHPLEVVEAAVNAWQDGRRNIDISQVEGFVRQIIGWREYMRGVYWAKMPGYAELNFFEHKRPLPEWYWTGNTKMDCLKYAVGQSLEYAYAHHIQRLMVTGNFALLAGIDPDEVDAWYLGIYIDAIEWVEITNTRGMSQFADGGIVGTKPYVSSANYIKKMSNYCDGCAYDPKKKVGDEACPFNSLYWHFYDRHKDKLQNNPRIGMMYRTWDKMDDTAKKALLIQAETYLTKLNEL